MPSIRVPIPAFTVTQNSYDGNTRTNYSLKSADWSLPDNTTLLRAYFEFAVVGRTATPAKGVVQAAGYEYGNSSNSFRRDGGSAVTGDLNVSGQTGTARYYFGISIRNSTGYTGQVSGKVSYDDVVLVVEYKINTTACKAPENAKVSADIAEYLVSLSWNGASAGVENPITGYDIEYSDSQDRTAWGSWTHLTSVQSENTYGSLSVFPPDSRGSYRRFRIMTKGSAGESFYSQWTNSYPIVRKNTLPSTPGNISVSTELYESGNINISWSESRDDTGTVASYRISYATSPDNMTWSEKIPIRGVTTTETVDAPTVERGLYFRYIINAIDSYGGISADGVSPSILKNAEPNALAIVWPNENCISWTKRPAFLVTIPKDKNGKPMSLQAKNGEGAWNTVATIDSDGGDYVYIPSGALPVKELVIAFRTIDHLGAYSPVVSVKIEIAPGTWGRTIAAGTEICTLDAETGDAEISHIEDINELVDWVNVRRRWYGLVDFFLTTEVGLYKNWQPQMQEIYDALAACYRAKRQAVKSMYLYQTNYPCAATFNDLRKMVEEV